ncbi:MAG: FISUMP domain-containing protein, partial [Flavobacteriales bacterium]|nr:FISUMP domain-containing protein [Flavobacteriales bacterium]
ECCQSTFRIWKIYSLYNWSAVMTEGICPSGWHIPSDGEFTDLTDFLGGASVAGGKMKSTSGWNDGGNGSNSSGWSGLPGGYRYSGGFISDSGGFTSDGYFGFWWSASESIGTSWGRRLNYFDGDVYEYSSSRSNGLSARCVRD